MFDWPTLHRQAVQESIRPIRPGSPGERPFWKVNAHVFIDAPAFNFKAVEGAGAYRFAAKDDSLAKAHSGAPVTELEPKTGALTEFYAPDPGTPEAVAFWRPVFDGMRKILAKHSLEKSMMVGHAGDHRHSA